MARNIGADGSDVYRAVITITDHGGKQSTRYEGPYASEGAARGRVTFWRNYLADYDNENAQPTGTSRATGHVERAVTTWQRIGQPTTPEHRTPEQPA